MNCEKHNDCKIIYCNTPKNIIYENIKKIILRKWNRVRYLKYTNLARN